MIIKIFSVRVGGDVKGGVTQKIVVELKWVAFAGLVGLLVIMGPSTPEVKETYWRSDSSGKLHRKGCPYYGKSKGKLVIGKQGIPCRHCMPKEHKKITE